MQATYRLRIDELDKLVVLLQNSYPNQEVEITVQEIMDETEYLLSSQSNREHLERSKAAIESNNGLIEVSLEI
ncbi:MAG: hypothetical protein LBV04_06470 [Deferribacteraceae bacterium]|jgi:PHD/YefM family antitoxin component YafN of YafNO toxin-antitoxin module|nr:hypothetical protein [Deferribacteraceae bacterium]